MRLGIVNDDMPFLVDSIAATIGAHNIAIERIIHPVLCVTRDDAGRLERVGGRASPESMIYIETERVDARQRRDLVEAIERNLADVRAAVADWRKLERAMEADAVQLGRTEQGFEGAALLHWFLDRNFTLLGHEIWMRGDGVSEKLGIARNEHSAPILAAASRERALAWFEKGGDAPLLLKSNLISTVHRQVPLDLALVPVLGGKGEIAGLSIHAGLWTSAALSAPPQAVPVLRARLAQLEAKFGFDPKGHTGKALTHALTALPHDLVTAFQPEQLEELALTAMSLADRPRPKLVIVQSTLGRHLFAFVWLPRDDLTTARRVAIGEMLSEASHADLLSWSIAMEDGVVALIRYTLDLRGETRMPDGAALDQRLERMLRGWHPAVEAALGEHVEPARAARLALRHADLFPTGYRTANDAEEAACDVLRLAALSSADDRQVRLYRCDRGTPRLKIYRNGGPIALSDAVPVLENFGFRVIEEVPTELAGDDHGFIHDFLISANDESLCDSDQPVLEGAIAAVLENAAENDAFNRLIVDVGLSPRAVVLLRAWFRYLRQAGVSYGLATVVDALRRAPQVTKALIARFDAAHDPAQKNREAAVEAARKAIDRGLDAVSAIDDDRILRAYRNVIAAILRTNAFAPVASEALAFKIDSHKIPGLPAPVPWREIWVYSPRVEGIHLRAGPVARGGLRWSDRRDDFRTEILGLMKAQRVKNAVIVPTGAKGGFYPKQLPSPLDDRDAWFAEGTEGYRVFIRALLSLTDNIVQGKVVHPAKVVIHDGDDPYFVVAADKGTAAFSDVANALAIERGFWLGDAFASGGSHGYDHKALGITARGTWACVRTHFRDLGIDADAAPLTAAGIGDPSRDVFGNGMRCSRELRLRAAFNHVHVFLDPAPDPARSFAERDRLFRAEKAWDAYDPLLLSPGGAILPRAAKRVVVSPEAQAMLGLPEA